MHLTARNIFQLLKDTFSDWNEDKAPRLGAALAYYTIFSLAPLLVIAIAIAGFAFGQQAAQGQIIGQMRGLVGDQGAEMIQTMIESSRQPSAGIIATVIGVVTLLLGALGFFGQLQDALNTIWEVAPKPNRGILGIIKDRFLSLTMVLGIGFLLLVSLVISAVLAGVGSFLNTLFPGAELVLQVVNTVISFIVITLLFAMIYKILPDVEIAWHDVWIGAVITTVLFLIGRFLLGLYLGRGTVGSTYGAAGSLIVVLVWVYYSAQILFFGAEFTQVYANKYGSRVTPAGGAVPVSPEMRAQQGLSRKSTKGAIATDGTTLQPPLPRPVSIKTNVLRQRATAMNAEAVPVPERITQVGISRDAQPSGSGILMAVFGIVIGVIAGLSLSHTATNTQRPKKR